MNTCPTEPRLTACLLGDLPKAEADAVHTHIESCPACRTAAAELAPLLGTLRAALASDAAAPLTLDPVRMAAILATPPPHRVSRRRTRFWLAPVIGLAATGIIVLSASLFFPFFESNPYHIRKGSGSASVACDIVLVPMEAEAADGDERGLNDENGDDDGLRDSVVRKAKKRSSDVIEGGEVGATDSETQPEDTRRGWSEDRDKNGRERHSRDVEPTATPDPVVNFKTIAVNDRDEASSGAFAHVPPNEPPAKASPEMRAKLQIAIADIAKAREEYPRAKAQYEGVVADPRSGRTDVAKQAELKIAEVDRLTRNYDAATERLEKLETDGNASVKSEARFQQAQIKFDQEDYAGAREALARVKEIAPDHKEAALLEGKLTVRTGKLMEATEIRLGSASPAADPKPSVDGPPVLDTLRPDTPGISKPDDNRTENGRKQNQSKYSPTVFNFPALQDSKVSEEVEKEFQKTHDTVTMAGTGSGSAIGENLATRGDLSVVAGEVARASRGTYTVNDSRVVSGKGGKMGAGGGSHGGWPDGMDGEKPDAPVTPDPVTPAPAPVAPPKASSTPVKPRVPAVFNPFVASAEQPLSTFAIDVDTASYTRTRQAILAGQLPEPEAVRTEEVVNAFDYGDRAPDHATFRIFVEGSPSPFGHGTSLIRLGIKGRRLGREESRPAVLTFVVDASGSMAQPDRFGLARLALDELLGRLGPNDRIQLIAFNDTARVLTEPIASSGRKEILAAFDRIQCTGSTHLESGLRLAYDRAAAAFRPGAENRVILISDGVANLGTGAAADILTHIDAARRQGITLAVFGVGRGTYNDEMLEQLANRGDGTYRFLDSADEVRRAFVDDLAATLYNIASDVKIQVEWLPAAVSRYRQLGYENRALTAEQFRDDTVDAGEVGSGQSVTALYEIERAALAPRAAAEAPLGMVRVRYRPATGGPVAEISRPILAADLAAAFPSARPQFRIAACAAAFAERLRGSPYANGFSFADVANVLRPAVMEFTLDARLADLLRLIETADRLAK